MQDAKAERTAPGQARRRPGPDVESAFALLTFSLRGKSESQAPCKAQPAGRAEESGTYLRSWSGHASQQRTVTVCQPSNRLLFPAMPGETSCLAMDLAAPASELNSAQPGIVLHHPMGSATSWGGRAAIG